MKEHLAEILYVIALSKRTQWAFLLGMAFFIGINLMGDYYVSRLHFSGSMAGLEQAVIPKLLKRYDKAAWFALISFWVLAFKCYQRDKRRFF